MSARLVTGLAADAYFVSSVSPQTSNQHAIASPPFLRITELLVCLQDDRWQLGMVCIASGSEEVTAQHRSLDGPVPSQHRCPLVIAEDPAGKWKSLRQLAPDGAMLVRPDGHVAWRCHSLAQACQPDDTSNAGHTNASAGQPGSHGTGAADGSAKAAAAHAQSEIGEELPLDNNTEQAACSHLQPVVAGAIHHYSSEPDGKLACRLMHAAMSKLLC